MKVKVIKTFRDKETGSILKPGIIIDITEERVEELTSALAPFVEVVAEYKEKGIDVEDLTVAQIKDLLDQMNIKYDSKMKRDELIALIEVGD